MNDYISLIIVAFFGGMGTSLGTYIVVNVLIKKSEKLFEDFISKMKREDKSNGSKDVSGDKQ